MVGAKKPELIGREEKELRKCKVQQEYGAVLSRIKGFLARFTGC